LPDFTDDIISEKGNLNRRGSILPIVLLTLILALLFFSILLLSTSYRENMRERLVVSFCSWLLILPGIYTIRSKSPILYARFTMFALFMIVLMALGLGTSGFSFPIHLIIVFSLWAQFLPFPFLYKGGIFWFTIIVDLLLLGAFYPSFPLFHYPSLLLMMFIPFSIITWESGWLGGLAGFIPLIWGILYGRVIGYRDEGLFLLIWAPILGGGSASLGLFVSDYNKLKKMMKRLQIFWPLGKEVLEQESFKEAMRTVLKYILENIPSMRYSLSVEGEEIEPFSFQSIPPLGDKGSDKCFRLQRDFSSADFKGEVILEREEEFSQEEEEVLKDILEEVMPAIEKILYLEKAVEVAATDPLTSLSNRRYFLYFLREDINRANRYKIPVSLLFLDIDGFKAYNDKYGHLAGDEVLRKISQTMKKLVRKTDITARYGGDEFAILFPHIAVGEAIVVGERIRDSVKELRLSTGDKFLTVSGGLTMYRLGERLGEFLRRADELLYQAKSKGGDRIEVG
jgi:diguanylate cyclase (GGDEF)-like protein